MTSHFIGASIFMLLFSFIGIVAGIALFVLIFIVLLKANKLLQIKINKEDQTTTPSRRCSDPTPPPCPEGAAGCLSARRANSGTTKVQHIRY